MQKSLQDIIRKVKAGDSKAFRMLVEENQGRAYRLAWRMLGNEADARDVVQDSFIKMWKKIHSYREDQQFSNWMDAIVSNTAIDRIRARRREDTVSSGWYSACAIFTGSVLQMLRISPA